ncbi:MAG: hypothetical protein JST00_17445 [Deltaproteobacteria bacterium]|nr:hypothetical protein [Deltaproteobacteria bacterium]
MGRAFASMALACAVAACTLTTNLDELSSGPSSSDGGEEAAVTLPGDAIAPSTDAARDAVVTDVVGDEEKDAATTTPSCTSGAISTIEKAATSATFDNSGAAWSAPTAALVQDATAATVPLAVAADESSFLRLTGFAFGLPADAVVKGLSLRIRRRAAAGVVRDREIRLSNGGVLVGADKKESDPWPSAFGDRIYGGATDLWAATLSPAVLDASGFGVAIKARLDGVASAEAAIDAVTLTVHYCR